MKKSTQLLVALAAAIVITAGAPAQAAVIASWDFTTLPFTTTTTYVLAPQTANTADPNVTVSQLNKSANETWGYSDNVNQLAVYNAADTSTLATAISAGAYETFTINVAAGYSLNLSSMSLATSRGSDNNTASGTSYLLSSLTGFTAANAVGSGLNDKPWIAHVAPNYSATVPWSVDLTGSFFQNLTSGSGPVEFRVYTPAGAYSNNGIQQLTLNGVITAVPEPSTWMLLAVGLPVITVLRRRQRNA